MDHREQLPPGTRIRILESSKTGHVVSCLGIAHALDIKPEVRPVQSRGLFAALAPWGPSDPRDASTHGPWPDIAIASARETVPALRRLKKASGGRVFTVFLGDPRTSRSVFDLIWAPRHDRIEGPHVIKTLTAPHPHSAAALEEARKHADPGLANLPSPRIACLIGGPNQRHDFGQDDIQRTCDAIRTIAASGASIMVSPSRRTPPALITALANLDLNPERAFIWNGAGDNPYRQLLALADAFLVTSDSVNMIGEALTAGKPVQVLMLAGDPGKFARFYAGLRQAGHIRDWNGALELWQAAPLDSTPTIADELARRYRAFRQRSQ